MTANAAGGVLTASDEGEPYGPLLWQHRRQCHRVPHRHPYVALAITLFTSTAHPPHLQTVGAVILRGPGLTIIEATAVSPEGRGTLHDCGLWSDAQVAPLRELVQFAHSQGQKIGVQLGHAGRKGSTAPLWLAPNAIIPKALGGWPEEVLAPSPNAYKEGDLKKAWMVNEEFKATLEEGAKEVVQQPKELTKEGIREVVGQWAAAAKRAVDAGIDVIEIHAAHGYLLHEFLSPVANKRMDDYGGSFENRARIVIEVVDAIRKVIPDSMPLFLRYATLVLLILKSGLISGNQAVGDGLAREDCPERAILAARRHRPPRRARRRPRRRPH